MIKKGGRKAQVTLFVVIAIVLVAGVIFYFLLRNQVTRPAISSEDAQKLLAAQIEPIKKYTTDCVAKTYKECTEMIGYQGGYYHPAKFIPTGNYSLTYLVYKEGSNWVNDLPLLTTIERNIEECLTANIAEVNACINDFQKFREVMDIEKGTMSVRTASIEECSITVDFTYPLTLKRSGAQTSIEKMPFSVPVCLGQAYRTAVEITNSEVTTQGFDIDSYTVKNPMYIYIKRQGLPEGIFYYMETIPPTTGFEAYKFNFGIQR